MDSLENIYNELTENGKVINYTCRFILDSSIEQTCYLYEDELYVVSKNLLVLF